MILLSRREERVWILFLMRVVAAPTPSVVFGLKLLREPALGRTGLERQHFVVFGLKQEGPRRCSVFLVRRCEDRVL